MKSGSPPLAPPHKSCGMGSCPVAPSVQGTIGLSPQRWWATLSVLFLLLLLAMAAYLLLGGEISLRTALQDRESMDAIILFRVRLPRLMTAAVAGATLAVAGAALQALLRNPLADPFIFGVSGGAALGGTLASLLPGALLGSSTTAIFLGSTLSWAAPFTMPLGILLTTGASFMGALAASWLTFRLALQAGRVRVYHALLVGVMINSIAAAGVTLVKLLLGAEKAHQILMWLMGTLAVEALPTPLLLVAMAIALITTGVLCLAARSLNIITLGEEQSEALGVDSNRLARFVIALTAAGVGVSVAITGLIGFVGLLVPHAARSLSGSDHRLLMPVSAMGGALLLVVCDLAGRSLFPVAGTEIPVGALTALLGGPSFIWIIHRVSFDGNRHQSGQIPPVARLGGWVRRLAQRRHPAAPKAKRGSTGEGVQ